MQLSIKFFLLFIMFFSSASAQWLEPFSPNIPSENYFHEESAGKNVFSQELFSAMDYYSFSGDLLINVFSQNNLLNDNALLLPPGTTMPNAPTIAGIPLGNGILFLAIIVMFYLSILFVKKQKLQMKKLKNSLCILFFLTLCSGNTYAQLSLKAVPDNAFVLPGSGTISLDVLHNDELGACTRASIEIQLIHPTTNTPVLSTITNNGGMANINPDKTIAYIPASTFVGQDSLRYQIICDGTASPNLVLVLINVTDKPENVMNDACAVLPVEMVWTIDGKPSGMMHSPYQVPIVGDLDGDGIVEIIVSTNPGSTTTDGIYRPSSSISIYKGNDISTPYLTFLTVKPYSWDANTKIGAVKTMVENSSGVLEDTTLIIVAEGDRKLRAYNYNGNFVWESDEVYHSSDNRFAGFSFADFNKDGIPEILIGGKLFDSSTGNLLCSTTATTDLCIAADLFGEGKLNYITGNRIYDVAPDLTSLVPRLTITPPTITNADLDYSGANFVAPAGGSALCVDVDNDGNLELVVSVYYTAGFYTILYVADPRTNTIKASKYVSDAGASGYPFAGDIDGDGYIELVIVKSRDIGSGTRPENYVMAYKYNAANPNLLLEEFWRLSTNDGSGLTGITLFDFDQDGKTELVYRDETHLRIIDGSANPPVNKAIFPNLSGTGLEYPIVADVDADGQAEILIVGGYPSMEGTSPHLGPLWVYKSAEPEKYPWAPARPVWNQYAYNPVYVNDDLSIPKNPINPATFFVDKDGNRHQPFNNFLQQATLMNDEGKMLSLGADLTFDETFGTDGATFVGSGNNYIVNIWVTNEGDAPFPSPLTVSAYGFTGTELVKLTVSPLSITIPDGSIGVGETEQLTFTIVGAAANFAATNIQLRLNESDNVFPASVEECRYWNNYYNRNLWGAPDQVLCEGDSTVYFYPLNSPLDYAWWTHPTSTVPSFYLEMNKGKLNNPASFVKNGTAVQSLYVDVYEDGVIRTTNRVEVKVYLTPDTLIWTGLGNDSDWHNKLNWFDPADPLLNYPENKIPRSCTNVLIPDGLDFYPVLDVNNTNRRIYWDAACNNIHFEFGGEVARTDSLHYSKAFVQYNFGYYDSSNNLEINDGYENINNPSHLERNRWYTLAAPLKKMVTGDFSFGGKPHTWQQGFVASNTSGAWTGSWELPVNTNDLELDESLNYAIALWAAGNIGEIGADASQGYQNGLNALNGVLTIPYFQGSNEDAYDKGPHRIHKYEAGTSYFSYYWQHIPNVPLSGHSVGSIARGDESYRFIFDKQLVNVGGKATFKISVPAGKEIMIGNPFMSTLNFGAFYAANGSSKMESVYRLFEDESWEEYSTGLIAPLQGFFLQTKGTVGTYIDLEFPFEDVSITRPTGTEHLLKSSMFGEENHLYITATNKEKSNSIQLVLNESNETNIYKLFNSEAKLTPQIYFTDEDNQKNAIQFVDNSTKKEIPLGLSLPAGHRVDLSFSNLENLQIESLYLLDKQTGIRQDLFRNPIYTFLHADMNNYTERFVLEVGAYNPTYIDHIQTNEISINIYQTNESITISSKEKIEKIELFDMKGQKIQEINNINNNIYQMNTNLSTGIYLIKTILMNGELQTDKIVIR